MYIYAMTYSLSCPLPSVLTKLCPSSTIRNNQLQANRDETVAFQSGMKIKSEVCKQVRC